MSDRVKQLPNVFSALRTPLGLGLLLIPLMSPGFMVRYLICCFTDVLGGFLARRLDARSMQGDRWLFFLRLRGLRLRGISPWVFRSRVKLAGLEGTIHSDQKRLRMLSGVLL